MSKVKYTGRNLETLMSLKPGDPVSPAEQALLIAKAELPAKEKKPSKFGLFIAGAIEGGARAMRERSENIMKLGEERYVKNAETEAKDELVKEFRDKLDKMSYSKQ